MKMKVLVAVICLVVVGMLSASASAADANSIKFLYNPGTGALTVQVLDAGLEFGPSINIAVAQGKVVSGTTANIPTGGWSYAYTGGTMQWASFAFFGDTSVGVSSDLGQIQLGTLITGLGASDFGAVSLTGTDGQNSFSFTDVVEVPEPASLLLLSMGGLALLRRRTA